MPNYRHHMRHLRQTIVAWFSIPLRRGGIYLTTLVMALLTVSLLISFINQVIQSTHMESQRLALLQEVQALEAQNIELLGAVEYAESDLYVEHIAREELGYARDGDIVISPQFLEPPPPLENNPPPSPAVAHTSPPSTPNWRGWWNSFFPTESHQRREGYP